MNQTKKRDGKGLAYTAAASLFLVPLTSDRLALGRSFAAPLISSRSGEVERARLRGHPDLLELVAPEGKDRIGIAQVRELIRSAQFSPVQGDRKVCLIPRAESLTPEASNALLKIMEEPPRDLAFVLLSGHPSDLLPTIVSRSRVVRFLGASSEELQAQFRAVGYSDSQAAWLARQPLRDGEAQMLLGQRLDIEGKLREERSALAAADTLTHMEACLAGPPLRRRVAMLYLFHRLEEQDANLMTSGIRVLASQDRDILGRFLHELMACAFDILRSSTAADALQEPQIQDLMNRIEARRLLNFCLAIEASHQSLAAYGPPEGNLLSLFLEFKGAGHAR